MAEVDVITLSVSSDGPPPFDALDAIGTGLAPVLLVAVCVTFAVRG